MILEFNAINAEYNSREYNLLYKGSICGYAYIDHKVKGYLNYNKKTFVNINESSNNELRIIDETETIVATIVGKREINEKEKKSIFRTNEYVRYELTYNNTLFSIYDTCLGKNKNYVTIYRDNQIVAVIHHLDKIKNFCHSMIVYSENDKDIVLVAVLYAFYLHQFIYYESELAMSENSGTFNRSYSKCRPYLQEKFDPAFIPRIIAMEENDV